MRVDAHLELRPIRVQVLREAARVLGVGCCVHHLQHDVEAFQDGRLEADRELLAATLLRINRLAYVAPCLLQAGTP